MGLFRLGGLIKFIPYTITTGFTSGIAVTIVIGQLKDFFGLKFDADAALVGVGAPIHLFLPDVAKVLGVECVIPDDSAVASAVGAAAAEVMSYVSVEIRSGYDSSGVFYYTVHARDLMLRFEKPEDALQAAQENAVRLSIVEARERGAEGDLKVDLRVEKHMSHDKAGTSIDLGTTVYATACGRPKDML